MLSGKEKIYFLLEHIVDAKDIAPSGQPLVIDAVNDLNRNYRDIELVQLFNKLEKDEKILKVLKVPKRVKEIDEIEALDPYDHADDGCWHIQLLPAFDSYYLDTQYEPEYQEFTGKKPPAPTRTRLSRKSLEKIWNVLQEIEDKRGITPSHDYISIPQVHLSKVKNIREADVASEERYTILRKLEKEDRAIKDVVWQSDIHKPIYLKIGSNYSDSFDYYEKEYKNAAKSYQQEQALRPAFFPKSISSPVSKATAREIVNEFSTGNYSFVLMVLKRIASLVEFSANNEVHYQLQSPAGQMLIQERSLLTKLQSKGLFRNMGEDGIFGIATLRDIDTQRIKEVIAELEMKKSGVISQEEFEEIKAKHTYDKLVEEITKPASPSLDERYNKLLTEVRPKQEEATTHETTLPVTSRNATSEWSDDFQWKGKEFVFGQYGSIRFSSKTTIDLFRELTNAKGNWVTVKKLREATAKADDYVRPTIGQIERRMTKELSEYISFPSTEEDTLEPMPAQGAYRIKFTPKPL